MKIKKTTHQTVYDYSTPMEGAEPRLHYVPRGCFQQVHRQPWKHGVIIAHRRAGKTFSAIAECVKRTWNSPPLPSGLPQQVLFTSPQLDQAMANTLPLFTTIASEFIADISKQDSVITLKNNARIIYCGARSIEKVRGLYLTGWLSDEVQKPIEDAYTDIIYPALVDTDGWSLRIGTARSDDDYLLYNTWKQLKAEHEGDPEWLFMKVGIHDSNIYTEEKLKAIKEGFFSNGRAARKTMAQIQQGWNCEYEADFSFIDEGKPNMSAMFYEPLLDIFNGGRIYDTDERDVNTPMANTAVFDIAAGSGRDYTVVVCGSYTVGGVGVHVSDIKFDNKKNLSQWADEIKGMGIKTVVLPHDAAQTNKETGLNLFDFFLKRGFRVYKIKKLLTTVQAEHAHWLLSHGTFDSKCISALRELGKFEGWEVKHKLSQDVASAVCYAGQFFRKAHIKEVRANRFAEESAKFGLAGESSDYFEMMGPVCGGAF